MQTFLNLEKSVRFLVVISVLLKMWNKCVKLEYEALHPISQLTLTRNLLKRSKEFFFLLHVFFLKQLTIVFSAWKILISLVPAVPPSLHESRHMVPHMCGSEVIHEAHMNRHSQGIWDWPIHIKRGSHERTKGRAGNDLSSSHFVFAITYCNLHFSSLCLLLSKFYLKQQVQCMCFYLKQSEKSPGTESNAIYQQNFPEAQTGW